MRAPRLAPRLFAAALFAAPIAALSVGPVEAAAPEKSDKIGQYVDLQALAIPVVRQGRLVNYVFVQARVNLTDKADSDALRAKAPYFRDALVRAAHRQSLIDPKDPTRLNEAALTAVLAREAARVAGPGLVASAEIVFQNSQRRTVR